MMHYPWRVVQGTLIAFGHGWVNIHDKIYRTQGDIECNVDLKSVIGLQVIEITFHQYFLQFFLLYYSDS